MNRIILYYPTIDVPSNSWLRNSLLYWDKVSSIVPQNIDVETELSRDIHYLIDENQFTPIRPDELIENPENFQFLQKFEKEFVDVVRSEFFQRLVRSQPFSLSRIKDQKFLG